MPSPYAVRKESGRLVYMDAVENVKAALPADVEFLGLIEKPEPEPGDPDAMVTAALEAPVASPKLSEIAKGRRDACVIVSDATRAVQTAFVLPHLVRELETGGIGLDRIVLVVALGVHRPATDDEMQAMLGPFAGKMRIENHEPFNPDKLVDIGTTSFGNRILVNSTVHAASVRIAVGKVEPHEFAGYSGGRKSVLPGISAESTIARNHSPEMILHPNAGPGVLEGNPIHQDMLEAAKLLGVDFTVNLVQNAAGKPLKAFAGGLEAAHDEAVRFANANYGAAVPAGANLYLATPGKPLNIDLYQSVKPLIALYPALNAGDVVVLYAACPEGVNSPDMLLPFEKSADVAGVTKFLNDNYRIQMDHSLLLCKLYRKGVRFVGHSPGVGKAVFEKLLMTSADSVADALQKGADLVKAGGGKPRLCVFPMPQRMVVS
jgi:nickel-dependent lactate racemase